MDITLAAYFEVTFDHMLSSLCAAWDVPQKWYDLYPLDTIELAPNPHPPQGVPSVALNDILNGCWSDSFSDFGALRANGSITAGNPYDNSTLPDYWARRARQAYWAATS